MIINRKLRLTFGNSRLGITSYIDSRAIHSTLHVRSPIKSTKTCIQLYKSMSLRRKRVIKFVKYQPTFDYNSALASLIKHKSFYLFCVYFTILYYIGFTICPQKRPNRGLNLSFLRYTLSTCCLV
jgi:hypothetical protein